jgi:beta-glucuronidase
MLRSLLALCGVFAARAQAPAWPQAPARTIRVLHGAWSFGWLGDSVAAVEDLSPAGLATPFTVTVPGAPDLTQFVQPGANASVNAAGAHGTMLYRRRFYQTPRSFARLFVGACGFWCSVWLDGARLGEKGGDAYSPAWFGGIAPAAAGWRTLEIIVDNRFNFTRAPLMAYCDDWYLYGGLFRSVELHELPAVALARTDVLVLDAAAGAVDVRVHVHDLTETTRWRPADIAAAGRSGFAPRYRGAGPAGLPRLPASVNISVAFDDDAAPGGAAATVYAVALDADGVGVLPNLRVPAPRLWAPAAPQLHTLSLTVGADVLVERFGLRTVGVCSAPSGAPVVCLNGAPAKLLGYGRHDTGPQEGHAISDFARLRDIQLVAGLGGSYMRLGHYAQHPNIASLADEMGMLNGVEVIGWDAKPETYTDPLWLGAGIASLEAATNASFNHAATITYAYINEGASDNKSVCGAWALFNARFKALRVQGLTTYANDRGVGDVCFAASGADLMGLNTYPGWYNAAAVDPAIGWARAPNLALVAEALDAFKAWMAAQHPGKPFMVSELGAGAIPGWQDELGGYWSESYQARLLYAGAAHVVQDDAWSGIALWQLMDQRVYNGAGALSRPRAFNNKGTFDQNRKMKPLAWAAVQAAFAGAPQPSALAADLLPG